MSGQWEVVGKRKDKASKDANQKNPKQLNKTTPKSPNVNVEEVLAKSQVRNLYSIDKNKENRPAEMKKPEGVPKKAQKTQDKAQEVVKPKPPKSIESALNQIDVKEFKSILQNNRAQFADAPIIWLKSLSWFLNQRLNVEVHDPVFSNKPECYPLECIPSGILSVIQSAVHGVDKKNLQLFYEISLTAMATDMSKNFPTLGYKLFLQYIALRYPKLVVANLEKHCNLRNSYQNRPNIGLSILWAVGHAGLADFQAGIEIFQELMLPLIELKNYSRFIVQYLITIFKKPEKGSVTKEQYASIMEIIYSNKKNFPNDLKQDLLSISPRLGGFLMGGDNTEWLEGAIDFFLKILPTTGSDEFEDYVCDVITYVFALTTNGVSRWGEIYSKNITASAILLRHINKNWDSAARRMGLQESLHVFNEILSVSKQLKAKKKKDEELAGIISVCEELMEKRDKREKYVKSSSGLIFLFFATPFIVFFLIDCGENGWKDSITRHYLEKYGVLHYLGQLRDAVYDGLLTVDSYMEKSYPSYATYRDIANEYSKPYVEFFWGFAKILENLAGLCFDGLKENVPGMKARINYFWPGLMEQSTSYYNKSVRFMQSELFISTEDMQKMFYQVFNTTQTKAVEYYHWLYEKVQSAIK